MDILIPHSAQQIVNNLSRKVFYMEINNVCVVFLIVWVLLFAFVSTFVFLRDTVTKDEWKKCLWLFELYDTFKSTFN